MRNVYLTGPLHLNLPSLILDSVSILSSPEGLQEFQSSIRMLPSSIYIPDIQVAS
jgi:hypothetical protein